LSCSSFLSLFSVLVSLLLPLFLISVHSLPPSFSPSLFIWHALIPISFCLSIPLY
jgi:hypothetical protein